MNAGLPSSRRTFLALALSGSASLAAAANPWTGVWHGTIGDQRITACFNHAEYDTQTSFYGNYYYDRYRKPITLRREPPERRWKEIMLDPGRGLWDLDPPAGDKLSGRWSRPGQKESFPIRLVRVPLPNSASQSKTDKEFARECAWDAYNLPLEVPPKVVIGEVQSFEDRRYRLQNVSVDGADGVTLSASVVELLEPGSHIDAINRQLTKRLPRTLAEMKQTLYWCRRNQLDSSGEDGDSANWTDIRFWTDRWLSVEDRDTSNCGGAHPSAGGSYRTWDLASGKELNLWTWFRNSRKPDSDPRYAGYYFSYAAPEKMNNIIVNTAVRQAKAAGHRNDPGGCIDVLKGNTQYRLRLGKEGMVFSTVFPHASQACDENVEIPYAKLLPFLTKAGREAVMTITGASGSAGSATEPGR
jgi:hypothetical protein